MLPPQEGPEPGYITCVCRACYPITPSLPCSTNFPISDGYAVLSTTSGRALLASYSAPYLFHQRCACHIINLIAKGALKLMKQPIGKIRSGIVFLNSSNPRLADYKNWCSAAHAASHVYNVDIDIRWNSSYIMIRDLIRDQR